MDHQFEDQFLRLFLASAGDLYRFVACMAPSPKDTDDLFQEASLRLWTQFDHYDPERPFLPWARGVVRLLVLEQRRRQRRSIHFSESTIEAIADAAEGLDPQGCDRQSALNQCLNKLDARDRDLLRMRYQESKRPKDIALDLGKSAHMVYRALARVHRNLANCVRRSLAGDA